MSPIIILGLLLMWAVVLVPMWLRRHDEVEESRSVDRFSAAMHTLSRYDDTQRDAMKSHRSRALSVHVSGASAPEAIAARRRRGMARRRARALAVLVITDLVVLIAAVVTGMGLVWAMQVVLDLAVVAFFLHLRRMAALAAAARRRAARQARNARQLEEALAEPAWEQGVTVRPAARIVDPMPARRVVDLTAAEAVFDQTALPDDDRLEPAFASAVVSSTSSDGFFDQETDLSVSVSAEPGFIEAGARRATRAESESVDQPQRTAARAAKPAQAAKKAAAAEAVGGAEWEPVPVPRPTYTMKPAAPARPARRRVISEPILPPVETVAELDSDDDLEAILDRRWAVND